MVAGNNKNSNKVNKSTSRNYLVASFFLIFIGVFITFFYFYKSYDYAQKCQTYLKTDAVVVDHNYDNNNRIVSTVIEYEVDGKKFKSTYNFKSLNIQPYGSTIQILYNPTYPDRITTIDSKVDAKILYFGGFIIFLGFAGAIIAVNKKDQYRKQVINGKYQVSSIDASLSNEYQVNQSVDSVYRQLAAAIDNGTMNQNAKVAIQQQDGQVPPEIRQKLVAATQTQEEEPEVIEDTTNIQVQDESQMDVSKDKPSIEEQPKQPEEEMKHEVTFASRVPEKQAAEEIGEEVQEDVKEEQPLEKKELVIDPIDALLNEYASVDEKVKSDEHFYKKKEKTKFEFASYANNTSITDLNPNEVGSFIPNIDDVEELFMDNKKNNN